MGIGWADAKTNEDVIILITQLLKSVAPKVRPKGCALDLNSEPADNSVCPTTRSGAYIKVSLGEVLGNESLKDGPFAT